jgi:CDP-diacylglycerol--glycerol-3-phosphate 3-phosphatidyltransferase
MRLWTTRIWLVESISLSRLLASLIFASLAFQDVSVLILAGLYVFAMGSDLIDGYLARKLKVETYFGKVVDLVSDKSLTIVSLLYAAARGIDIMPLALIATREIITIGARIIVVEGRQLLPTNKILGGIMWLLLWGNTLFLLLISSDHRLIVVATIMYWICAIVLVLNLIARLYVNARRIKISLKEDQ